MVKALFLLGPGAALLGGAAAMADVPGRHSVSVRNDTGGRVECGIHKEGSSVMDGVTLKAGQVWTQTYGDPKSRWLRCEGVYSTWQRLAPDSVYSLVKDTAERIVATPTAR
jgi:hypothetical protein